MRNAKKSAAKATDESFERMYRTIPNDHAPRGGARRRPSETEIPEQQPPEQPKPHRARKIFKRLLLFVILVALLYGLWVGWKLIGNGIQIFGWNGVWSLLTTREVKGEKEGRINLLLAGNSADDPGHNGADLTDSIMVVSINPKDKTGYMLSIPRDLYVDIPDYGYAKINEAYQAGEAAKFSESGYAAGGMGLLEKVIYLNFGIESHYYALVNYTALQQAVDAVGGITVTIQSNDPRGLYDPSPDLTNNRQPLVNLPNGQNDLDGRQALNLARARGNARGAYGYALSDFTRTAQQRQILLALQDKASSLGTLANPIKVGELFDSMGGNVQTDLELGEAARLYSIIRSVPNNKIQSVSLNSINDENYLENYTTRSGQSALVPRAGVDDYSEIRNYLDTLK